MVGKRGVMESLQTKYSVSGFYLFTLLLRKFDYCNSSAVIHVVI